MKLIGVIPARYASTRMPGKPLADILGKPMIWWVYQEAKKCKKLDQISHGQLGYDDGQCRFCRTKLFHTQNDCQRNKSPDHAVEKHIF